jgi:hypothetical protein
VDADEQDSESVEGTGEGAQWTVFFDVGVAAMRVEDHQPDSTSRVASNRRSRGRVNIPQLLLN